ncbi:hypothetical protein [Nonomuraea turkmeniaca]|nr:hypothetical protein [Nonomuraea turkmeniaca]
MNTPDIRTDLRNLRDHINRELDDEHSDRQYVLEGVAIVLDDLITRLDSP